MRPFAYARPTTIAETLAALSATARPKAGGYDLLDLAKRGVSTPEVMVDLSRVRGYETVLGVHTSPHDVVFVGAGVTLANIASSKEIQERCPVLSDAASEAATPQVRNVATVAGNVLQRPRCAYFRDPFFDCLKRGGKTCPAKDGLHDEAAIFGNGVCCATHPSNLAAALTALRASFHVVSGLDEKGEPKFWATGEEQQFFVRPETDPTRDTLLEPKNVIWRVSFPAARASAYVEVNQKQSYDWAAASCAAVLDLADGKIAGASVVLGAVAPVPWRVPAVEKALAGLRTDEAAAIAKAAALAADGATPLRDNAWKVRIVPVVVRRAVAKALERAGRTR